MTGKPRDSLKRSLKRKVAVHRPRKTLLVFARARKQSASTNKSLDPAKYMPLVKEVSRRAARLEKNHQRNGTLFPGDNPSSGIHRLLASVES